MATPAAEGADFASPVPMLSRKSLTKFHAEFALASMYIAMLLTEFSSVPAEVNGVPLSRNDIEKWEANPPEWKAASMIATFWVKVGSQWACLLMYAWTLLAPYLLRESRDFGIEFDD